MKYKPLYNKIKLSKMKMTKSMYNNIYRIEQKFKNKKMKMKI